MADTIFWYETSRARWPFHVHGTQISKLYGSITFWRSRASVHAVLLNVFLLVLSLSYHLYDTSWDLEISFYISGTSGTYFILSQTNILHTHTITEMEDWWHDAVIYQVYLMSFQDTTANRRDDLNGITSRLRYLKDLWM